VRDELTIVQLVRPTLTTLISLTLIFSWFALANLWLTFSIIINLVPDATHIYLFGGETVVSGQQAKLT
jgi:hypothetical protein